MPAQRASTPSSLLPGPIRRLREHVRTIRRVAAETRDAVYASRGEISDIGEALSRLEAQVNAQAQALADLTAHAPTRESTQGDHKQLVEILRFVLARRREAQQRLRQLRETPEYDLPFTERDPLVSVVLPTYDNFELLRTRALPSVLAQSYQNFEVVVVGDAAPGGARHAVEGFNDARIRFSNLPYRGPYPEDPEARWRVAGVPPYNEAVHLSRGSWIASLADDDAFRPTHLELVLRHAQAERLELAYARFCLHWENGEELHLGRFPPEHGNFGLQSVLYHRGLADIFELELADASLGLPSDWGMCRRMMEAGVRMGMLDDETADYYPSKVFTPRNEG